MDNELDIKIVNTWVDSESTFPIMIAIAISIDPTSSLITALSGSNALSYGLQIRDTITKKLLDELNLAIDEDYVYSTDVQYNRSLYSLVIKMRKEEHYVMFKLHFNS